MNRTYRIKKGRHRVKYSVLFYLANMFMPVVLLRETTYFVSIDFVADAGYQDPQDPPQWNKGPGLSSIFIHWKSVRMGWRYSDNAPQCCLYKYNKGNRFIGIARYGSQMTIKVPPGIYWHCFPYFGGKWPCPKDMKIVATIRKIKG